MAGMMETLGGIFRGKDDDSLLFFFLLLVIIFCNCGLFDDGDELLFFFLLLILLFGGGSFFRGFVPRAPTADKGIMPEHSPFH